MYKLTWPFLDVGCGVGDLSAYLSLKGWNGKAIDISEAAINKAKINLALCPQVLVEKRSLFSEEQYYNTIFAWDVVEHISDDQAFLKKISSLLLPGGYACFCVPSNPKEWRWDDDFYGHMRRYTTEDLNKKLINVGLTPIISWDVTYPVFWSMRRFYTFFKKPPKDIAPNKAVRTENSTLNNAWDLPLASRILNRQYLFWKILYNMQFNCCRQSIDLGHEMLVLAQKNTGGRNANN
ncbi:MAG: class I SAM-dependent methyltransferase [Candidatus Omnitrophica bacterium]|nr:class I SAM-dependent methyltransferase [Candidatus Omnitrophota bacterium]